MKIPRLATVMGEIDDDLISAAETYRPRRKKWHQLNWLKYGAAAACICITVLIAIPVFSELFTATANEAEKAKVTLTFAEAQAYEPFGAYLPSVAAEGYSLDAEVAVYNETVMEAVFVNAESGDTLVVRIASSAQYGAVETGKVLYREAGGSSSSYLYVDCGDYLVYYSSAECDLNEVEGFQEMVASSEYFAD